MRNKGRKKPNVSRSTSLEELLFEKFPPEIVDAINSVDLTVGEVLDWQQSREPVRIYMSDRMLHVSIQANWPIGAVAAAIGGILGALWAIVEFIAPRLAHFF